jgi:DNA-binding SARP family transcriptional activator
MTKPRVRIALLDGFSLELPSSPSPVVGLPLSVQRLIALVSLSGRPGRGAAAGQLWPDLSEANAQSSLRSALWRSHKLSPGVIEVSSGSLRLAKDVATDVGELVTWARDVLDPNHHMTDETVPDVALGGELLPGWYDEWVLLQREHLRQLRMHALEVLADKLASVHRFGEAMQAALAAVQAEPLRESAHRAVIRVHLAEGNVVEAVRVYDAFSSLVGAELGVPPSAQMTELVRGIRRPARSVRQPSSTAAAVGDVHVTAPRRGKDVSVAQH